MPALHSFDFAVIRVVPRVEREEFVNAGVILFCLSQKFLEALVRLDEDRLQALWPDLDFDAVRQHLDAFPRVCAGLPDGGPISQLSMRERFHWMVAPRSTVIQISPVHSGLCETPESVLQTIFHTLVLI